MRKLILGSMLVLAAPGMLRGQETAQDSAAAQKRAEALAKETQNPVANLTTIPIQFNWTTGGGLGAQTQSLINFQPVLPLVINKQWIVVSRTVVPMLSVPLPSGDRASGIADIQEQIYFTAAKPGKVIWGAGPIFSLPTATNSVAVTGQFALGPALVVLTMPGHWVIGGLVNNIWRIAGSSSTTAINAFFTQPFINYNLKHGWAISTSPSITANWNAPSGQQWTVPLGLGISKVSLIGKQPVNLSMQYYHNVVHPDNAGADVVRMVFALLYPRK